jgi:Zn-dependent peptidase ImmA (M78 family)
VVPVNVIAIARELGVNVWGTSTLPSNISGKIFLDPVNGGFNRFSITVNATEPLPRQRFTVAHELAHFLLHRDKFVNGMLVDDTMYRSGLTSSEEREANKLAAEILMPYSLLQQMIAQGIRSLPKLAGKFQVSKDAMSIRLSVPDLSALASK